MSPSVDQDVEGSTPSGTPVNKTSLEAGPYF
jgi:hypothetical protein